MAKILLVEDDQLLQEVYRDALTQEGYDVVSTATGKDTLFQAKSFHPDLILLDIMLPGGMNGFDILRDLKADSKLKKTPVIMLTNLDSERKTAMELGVQDYIVKADM